MMYLLDTQVFLWFVTDDSRLSATAKALIENPGNICYLSIASVWEMAIKISLGKLDINMPVPFAAFINEKMYDNNINLLRIKIIHTQIVATMPFHADHRDPFDRLIIAQSQSENFPIISSDINFDRYEIERHW